jgi:hypothetical protein
VLAFADTFDAVAIGKPQNQWYAAADFVEQYLAAIRCLVFGYACKHQVQLQIVVEWFINIKQLIR